MNFLRLTPTILIKYILKLFYWFFCMTNKVDSSKITFASYRSNELKDNIAYVNDYIEKTFEGYKRHFLFKKFDGSLKGKIGYIFHLIKACKYMATSRFFIVDDYYFPIYVVKPREGTEIIQLWHCAGALKKFGMSTVGKPFGPSKAYLKHVKVHSNYSKTIVSSREVVPYFAEAFDMKYTQVLPIGIPRTDYFFKKDLHNEVRKRFYAEFPELVGKKIILYAPTFRGKTHKQEKYKMPLDLKLMERELGEEYVLIVNLHPHMRQDLDLGADVGNGKFVIETHGKYKIEELLVLTDVLITDYSTVFFDYSLLERPMVFFAYDLEEYIKERDFYYDYEKLVPGPLVRTTEELVAAIKDSQFDLEKIVEFKHRFFDFCDGRSTERVVKEILFGRINQVTQI